MSEPVYDPSQGSEPWLRPAFIPGRELSRRFYAEAVAPILQRRFPGLPHSAALVGYGSDTIGFDDARSRDHMWGPRMVLLLPETNFAATQAAVDAALRAELPPAFMGYSTSFSAPNLDDGGVRNMLEATPGPVDHLIRITTLPELFEEELGWDTRRELTTADWLAFSEHRLLTMTSGGVWHDDLGLEAVRARLAYYPEAVWKYLLVCQWTRIGQEEPFVGRTHEAGDETGSRILAAKLVHVVMGLAFLLENRYAPYSKWFGTGFKRLELAAELQPHLDGALDAAGYAERETHLCAAYEICARRFNALNLIPAVPEQVVFFFDRPFKIIRGGDIADKLYDSIRDPEIRRLPARIGSINQFSDSTDLLESIEISKRMRQVFRGENSK
jgi:hypothetical protein